MSLETKRSWFGQVFLSAALVVMLVLGPVLAEDKAAKDPAAKKGWQEISTSAWKAAAATDIMDIVGPAYRGFPESAEGTQGLTIEVARSDDGKGFTAIVTKEGLLDDAVGAEQIRLEIERREINWHLVRAHRRWQCRRGIMAGSWTNSRCP